MTLDQVEEKMGRTSPWFVQQDAPLKSYHVAVCPYCDNPVRMKGLHKKTERSPRPYGAHVGTPVAGFRFDGAAHQYCPYILRKVKRDQTEKRSFDPMASKLIDLAVAEFDRIIYILRDDYGFRFSDKMAERFLRTWFSEEGYLYTGAHFRNLPWMVGYFARTEKVYGQPIKPFADMADAIKSKVAAATFDKHGQLLGDNAWLDLRMQTLKHRRILQDDHSLTETVDVRVLDFTQSNAPDKAREVFRYTITFNPDRFEGLINTPDERARRDPDLLAIAREVAEDYVR